MAVAHFLHPAHKLTELNDDAPYLCDGCMILGNGTRFSCVSCQFDMHVFCAKCPHVLTSTTMNHPHTMNLMVYKPKPDQTEPCQICQEPIQGLGYECKSCNFLVHPLCVSSNSGLNQEAPSALPYFGSTTQRSVPPSFGSTTQRPVPPSSGSTAQGIAQQVGVGVAVGVAVNEVQDGGGFFGLIESIFSSSSS